VVNLLCHNPSTQKKLKSHLLAWLSVFTILLALVAYMRLGLVSKAERFVARIGVSSEDF